MNPRFIFKKKNLKFFFIVVFLVSSLSFSIPALRPSVLLTLKQPLILFNLIRRELGAVIFYHRNFVENEKIKKELDLLKNRLNAYDEILRENMRLNNLLFLKQNSSLRFISAKVIARSPDSWTSSIIIGKGVNSGIRRGLIAISYLGFVGRVIETTDFTSKILLVSDPNMGISSLVKRSRQEGLVSGTLGNNLIMKYLPEDADIRVGDEIITSGLNQVCPKGLLIGSVISIGKEFSGLSSYAIIKPAVNLTSIEEVLIIIP